MELNNLNEDELFKIIAGLISMFPAYKFEDFLSMEIDLFFKILKIASERSKELSGKEFYEEEETKIVDQQQDKANLLGLLTLYGVNIKDLEEKNYKLNLVDLKKHQREKYKHAK